MWTPQFNHACPLSVLALLGDKHLYCNTLRALTTKGLPGKHSSQPGHQGIHSDNQQNIGRFSCHREPSLTPQEVPPNPVPHRRPTELEPALGIEMHAYTDS